MSCLKVDIRSILGDLKAVCNIKRSLKASIVLVRNRVCGGLRAFAKVISGLVASAKILSDFSVSVANRNTPVTVEIRLVCDVGLDTECYLQVLEGDLITIDGCYLKVMKA